MKVAILLLFAIYLYEILRLFANYLKKKNIFLHEPEVFLMIPIFFVYVINLPYLLEKEPYFTVFITGFCTLYLTTKVSKVTLLSLVRRKKIRKFSFQRYKTHIDMHINNILFLAGIFLFIIVFLKKGIPLLSENPDIARAQLGMGYILWPAFSFVNLSLWFDTIRLLNRKNNRYLLLYLIKIAIAVTLILFTGWRGQIIQLFLVILIITSFYKRLSLKYVFITFLFAIFLAFVGILRAYLSGKALYGGAINISKFTISELILLSILYLYYRFHEHFLNFTMTIDFINNTHPFYFKGLLMDLSILLPGKGQGLDFFLRNNLLERNWTGGGGLPPTLFGSLYVEYKIVSVIVLSFIIGLILSFLYAIATLKKREQFLPFYASSLVWAFKSIFGSIGQNFVTYNLTMTLLMLWYVFLMFCLEQILKKQNEIRKEVKA